MAYKHLSRPERGKIAQMSNNGIGIREIAKQLERSASTISRELRRNALFPGKYKAEHAQASYINRRRVPTPWKLKQGPLQEYVREKLLLCWSPEQITGRLLIEYPKDTSMRVAYSTIYHWLHHGLLEQAAALKINLRHYSHKHGEKRGKFQGIRELKTRSRLALRRKRLGDWEVDTIVSSSRTRNPQCLLSVCERKSRYCGLVLLKRNTASEVMRGFRFLFGDGALPLLTMTGDRGKEFACFDEVEKEFQIPFYFARPHSPWQKPSVENQNGLVRQFFPKGTDFHELSQKQVDDVVSLLNNRPKKCLAFMTPSEVLHFS